VESQGAGVAMPTSGISARCRPRRSTKSLGSTESWSSSSTSSQSPASAAPRLECTGEAEVLPGELDLDKLVWVKY